MIYIHHMRRRFFASSFQKTELETTINTIVTEAQQTHTIPDHVIYNDPNKNSLSSNSTHTEKLPMKPNITAVR